MTITTTVTVSNTERNMFLRGSNKVLGSIITAKGNSKKVSSTNKGMYLIAKETELITNLISENTANRKPAWQIALKEHTVCSAIYFMVAKVTLDSKDIKWKRAHMVTGIAKELFKGNNSYALGLVEFIINNSDLFTRNAITKDDKEVVTYGINPAISEDIINEVNRKAAHEFYPLPMTEKPINWFISDIGKVSGGYKTKQYPLVRSVADIDFITPDLLSAVNTMQSTAYRINIVAMEAIKNDLKAPKRTDFCTIVFPTANPYTTARDIKRALRKHLSTPLKDTKKSTLDKFSQTTINIKSWKYTRAQQKVIDICFQENKDFNSALGKYRATKLALDIAEQYKNEPEIYFPCNFDYRGRMYPLANFLHPQGDDKVKAMLEFAEGVTLTKSGAEYAYFTLAGLFGEDKKSFKERVEIGKTVLHGSWQDADEDTKYQFLALQTQLLKWEQDNSVRIYTPAHLDGSCNGSQHAAMLTGCEKTAYATNVLPNLEGSRNDAYIEVADKAKDLVKINTTKYKSYITKCLKENGRIYAKRPTMISIYGGKIRSFAVYTFDNMRKLNPDKKMCTTDCAMEFAKILKQSLESTLIGGKKFETWIQKVADCITCNNIGVHWITPDGFSVVVDKMSKLITRYTAKIGKKQYVLKLNEPTVDIDANKVKNCISPNVVHSLDATHLRMTMLACKARGVEQFNFIHDSFGCNMNDAHILLQETKQQWINLYGDFEVCNRLRDQFQEQSLKDLPEVPFLGGFDVDNVLDSEYFFS